MTPYRSQWMDENLEVFRRSVSQFVDSEMLPYDEKWREQIADIGRVQPRGGLVEDIHGVIVA